MTKGQHLADHAVDTSTEVMARWQGASIRRRMHASSSYILLALTIAALVYALTPHRIGLTPDGTVYVGSARYFLRGEGFVYPDDSGLLQPVTHYPLFYPAVLAVLGIGVGDVLEAARWASALSMAGLVVLSAHIITRLTNRLAFGIMGALVIVASPNLFINSLFALSEPLFMLLVLAGAYLLVRASPHPDRYCLIAAALAIGLAAVTRYAGLAFLAAAVIFMVHPRSEPLRRRLVSALVVGSVGALPLILLLLRNLLLSASATNRTLDFHAVTTERLLSGIHTIGTWLLPGTSPPLTYYLAGAVVLSTAVLAFASRPFRQDVGRFLALSGIFITLYLVFLLTSISLADAYTPLDGRILAPAQLFWLIGLVILLSQADERLAAIKYIRLLPAAFLLVLLLLNIYVTAPVAAESYLFGLGYSHVSSRESNTLEKVDSLPIDAMLYSNAPDLLHLYTGRTSRWLPRKYDPASIMVNPTYRSELQQLTQALEKQCAVLVYFYSSGKHRRYLPDETDLNHLLRGLTLARYTDGVIFVSGACPFAEDAESGSRS